MFLWVAGVHTCLILFGRLLLRVKCMAIQPSKFATLHEFRESNSRSVAKFSNFRYWFLVVDI